MIGRFRRRRLAVPAAIVAITVLAGVVFVATSLRREPLLSFAPTPTPAHVHEVGDTLVGPIRYTVDASASDRWRYFDFSRGSVVDRGDPLGWDLAFRRFHIIANGGPGFAGSGGILDLGDVPFDSVFEVPESGYVETRVRSDSVNPAIDRWYDYGWTSHLLTPKPRVYAVRTAAGRYAILRILSYYCPAAVAGCITFQYVYQGSGARDMVARPDHAAEVRP